PLLLTLSLDLSADASSKLRFQTLHGGGYAFGELHLSAIGTIGVAQHGGHFGQPGTKLCEFFSHFHRLRRRVRRSTVHGYAILFHASSGLTASRQILFP